jgi:hypothetical protein
MVEFCPVSDSTHHQKALTTTSTSFKHNTVPEEENDFTWKHFETNPWKINCSNGIDDVTPHGCIASSALAMKLAKFLFEYFKAGDLGLQLQ